MTTTTTATATTKTAAAAAAAAAQDGGTAAVATSSTSRSSLMHSPRKRQSLAFDEYGFELQKAAIEQYVIHVNNDAETDMMRMAKYEDCLFDTARGWKDSQYSRMTRTGVPRTRRRYEWLECTGLQFELEDEARYYGELLELVTDDADAEELIVHKVRDQIDKDVDRIGANCVIDKRDMSDKTRRVLLAYAAEFPRDGYTQGMHTLVAGMLLLEFSEQEAFHALRYVVRTLFPLTYSPTMTGGQADCEVLRYYMTFKCRSFMRLVEKFDVELRYFTSRVVLTLGFGMLPQESVYRVWDRMMAGGVIEFFKAWLRIFNAVDKSIRAKYQARWPRIDSSFLIPLIDAQLNSLVDITPVLVQKLPGRPLEAWAVNKRRMAARRLHESRRSSLRATGRRDSSKDVRQLAEKVRSEKNARSLVPAAAAAAAAPAATMLIAPMEPPSDDVETESNSPPNRPVPRRPAALRMAGNGGGGGGGGTIRIPIDMSTTTNSSDTSDEI